MTAQPRVLPHVGLLQITLIAALHFEGHVIQFLNIGTSGCDHASRWSRSFVAFYFSGSSNSAQELTWSHSISVQPDSRLHLFFSVKAKSKSGCERRRWLQELRSALCRAWLRFVVGFMVWIELDFTSIFNEVTLNALSLLFSPHWLWRTLLRTYGELSVSMLKCHLTNQCAHLHAIVDASVRL